MLRVGDSEAQTASVLAFPGKARMLQLREEDCNQETTEFQGVRPKDKDPNSQATIRSFLALPPHILPHIYSSYTSTQCHAVQSCLHVRLLLKSSIVCPRTQAQRQRVTSGPISWDPVIQAVTLPAPSEATKSALTCGGACTHLWMMWCQRTSLGHRHCIPRFHLGLLEEKIQSLSTI